jgi:hypothetical protein
MRKSCGISSGFASYPVSVKPILFIQKAAVASHSCFFTEI